jgi:membrane associated rhomboid family serine protease
VFFPIGDDHPTRSRPYVTWGLIAINVAVYLFVNLPAQSRGGDEALFGVFTQWGFDQTHPVSVQLFTSMFLHAGIAHLAGNMWMLWIVGDNVEDKLGRLRFIGLYLAGGVLAAWAYVVTSSFTTDVREAIGDELTQQIIPLVGASGAIFAIMGTYLVFFPESRIKMLLWFFFFVQVVPVRAKWIIGAWIFQDLVLTVLTRGDTAAGSVATAAHVGGALFGIAAGVWLKPRVGGGGIGNAWDVHTGFASAQDARFQTPWHGVGPRPTPVRPTESQLVAIEDAITRDVRSGRIDSALDLYPRYESMDREKPLPGPVQMEIAHEFFRRGFPHEALQAYRRYLRTWPRGDDAAEASFRIGILLGRAFGNPAEAQEHLERAAREHPDRGIRDFATAEIARHRA